MTYAELFALAVEGWRRRHGHATRGPRAYGFGRELAHRLGWELKRCEAIVHSLRHGKALDPVNAEGVRRVFGELGWHELARELPVYTGGSSGPTGGAYKSSGAPRRVSGFAASRRAGETATAALLRETGWSVSEAARAFLRATGRTECGDVPASWRKAVERARDATTDGPTVREVDSWARVVRAARRAQAGSVGQAPVQSTQESGEASAAATEAPQGRAR